MSIYDIQLTTIDGEQTTLSPYRGKVLLIVNTASACGLTPHYAGLQQLYDAFKEKGLVVLGFPCNQFAGQEPGSEEEIKQFCEVNYKITFPMFAKIDVKGDYTHPLYRFLLDESPEPYRTEEIEWNFVKFLVDREGNVIKQFGARTEPSSLEDDIQKLL